jgi:Zn-dependent protease with chaperone function
VLRLQPSADIRADSTWKHRHHTAAYHRYWAEMQGCRQQARERLMGAANKQARFVGTMRAGAPRRPPPALTVSRPLVAYLASHDKRRIHRSPQLLLAFVAPLTGHTAFHSFFNPCQCVEEIFLVSWSTLKSSDILGQLNLLARTTFSLLPLAAGLRMKSVRLARRHGAAYVARWFHPSRGFVIGLVLTPLALFALAYLASLEQTPISGRWRSLFVNDGERREIVRAFAGDRMAATTAEWLALLRRMLGDEAMRAPAGTLLGGACLDAAADWRVGFVEDTLHALESGIPLLGSRGPTGQLQVAGLVVPAASPPLAYARPAPHYRVLVVDRPEPNAFSCGFAPVGQRVGPGVIVVFSGALDAILAKHVGRGGFQGVPTREEQQDLAVLLSHELAHLLCSHTLEVHASDSQRPQLRKIFVDGAWRYWLL